jgi:hypothetical protein
MVVSLLCLHRNLSKAGGCRDPRTIDIGTGGAALVLLLLLLPFLLVMAGIGAAMLLWFVASAAVLGALVFWLVFPDIYGTAILLLALVIGLLLVDRRYRSRQNAS